MGFDGLGEELVVDLVNGAGGEVEALAAGLVDEVCWSWPRPGGRVMRSMPLYSSMASQKGRRRHGGLRSMEWSSY